MAGAWTILRGAPPVTGATHRALSAAKATLRPSGDRDGRWMPRTGRLLSASRTYCLNRRRGRGTSRVASRGIARPVVSPSGSITRKRPSRVISRRSSPIQRGGAGARSPSRSARRPSTYRLRLSALRGPGAADSHAVRPAGESAGLRRLPSVTVCSIRTGPWAPAGTEARVRAVRVSPVSVPRTNSTREPSGDQTGSKSSHAAAWPSWSCWPGPGCPGRPVRRRRRPSATETVQIRYGLPPTGSPPRSEQKARVRPSGDQAGARWSNGPSVSLRRPDPSARITQMWKAPPR